MKVTTMGIVKGVLVELNEKTLLPDGIEVQVTLETEASTFQEDRRLLESLFGAWADDDELAEIFRRIELDREQAFPRQVDLDVTP